MAAPRASTSATSPRRASRSSPNSAVVPGVVVSASHNPYYDNGLKVLGVGGGKLDYATELAVAQALEVAASPIE